MGVYDVEIWLPEDSRLGGQWIVEDCLGYPADHTEHRVPSSVISAPVCVFKRDGEEVAYQFGPFGWTQDDSLLETLKDYGKDGG